MHPIYVTHNQHNPIHRCQATTAPATAVLLLSPKSPYPQYHHGLLPVTVTASKRLPGTWYLLYHSRDCYRYYGYTAKMPPQLLTHYSRYIHYRQATIYLLPKRPLSCKYYHGLVCVVRVRVIHPLFLYFWGGSNMYVCKYSKAPPPEAMNSRTARSVHLPLSGSHHYVALEESIRICSLLLY